MKSYANRVHGLLLILLFSGAALHAQNISVTPKLIAFPNQGTGTTSASYAVTVWNNQTAALAISGITAPAPFTETDNCGTSLAANAKCTINVTFKPTAVQYYSSSLTITDSAANSPQVVSLTGNGVIPVSYTPKQVLFPNQGINSTSSAYTITLTNNQSTAMSISSIATAAPFAVTNTCGTSLAAGASCTVTVKFTPTAVKYYSSSVTITDSASKEPLIKPMHIARCNSYRGFRGAISSFGRKMGDEQGLSGFG